LLMKESKISRSKITCVRDRILCNPSLEVLIEVVIPNTAFNKNRVLCSLCWMVRRMLYCTRTGLTIKKKTRTLESGLPRPANTVLVHWVIRNTCIKRLHFQKPQERRNGMSYLLIGGEYEF
jgi:hypothetical protein